MSGEGSAGGFSKTRFERVHDVLGGYVERGELPGLVSLVSRRGEVATRGSIRVGRRARHSWFNDPHEELTAILMTQRAWSSPQPPAVCEDFWMSVYQAIDD